MTRNSRVPGCADCHGQHVIECGCSCHDVPASPTEAEMNEARQTYARVYDEALGDESEPTGVQRLNADMKALDAALRQMWDIARRSTVSATVGHRHDEGCVDIGAHMEEVGRVEREVEGRKHFGSKMAHQLGRTTALLHAATTRYGRLVERNVQLCKLLWGQGVMIPTNLVGEPPEDPNVEFQTPAHTETVDRGES